MNPEKRYEVVVKLWSATSVRYVESILRTFINKYDAEIFRDGYNAATPEVVAEVRERMPYVCPLCYVEVAPHFGSNKIEAIKHLRDFHRINGLKNAKRLVEEWKTDDNQNVTP